jgi:hypothetical protein|tara:strand:+ start:929 stop:1243 length:315 start_codon:yes stop_codon:yes gene_type:complete
MAGGSTFTSDQGVLQASTTTAVLMRAGRARITSVQGAGNAAAGVVAFHDLNTSTGISTANKKLEYKFGQEGLQMYLPGSGVLFKNGIAAVVTATSSVTITITGG